MPETERRLAADPRFRELARRYGLPESFTALPAR